VNSNDNRFALKKRMTHELILDATKDIIAEAGLEAFSLDHVADAANVSRATLFNHIHNRDELLIEVLVPVFDECIRELERLQTNDEARVVEAIESACVYLWRNHKGVLCREDCAHSLSSIPELSERHERLIRLFRALFVRLPDVLDTRIKNPERIADLTFAICIPILDALAAENGSTDGFGKSLMGLLTQS
jgi:AcrR family transcriptional regulator